MSNNPSRDAAKQAAAADEVIRDYAAGSDIHDLAPESGTEEAKAVRRNVQTLTEAKELPSFEQAMAEAEALDINLPKNATALAHKYGNRAVRYIKLVSEKGGWHCEGREDGPLTPAQSAELANVINSKKGYVAPSQPQPIAEAAPKASDAEIIKSMIEAAEAAESMGKLREIAHDAERGGYLIRKPEGHKLVVEAIEGVEGSAELVQAINSRKKHLLGEMRAEEQRKREREHLESRIGGFIRVMNEKNSDLELEKFVWQMLDQKHGFLKKVPDKKAPAGTREWTVEPIEGKEGSKELVDAVLARKAELRRLKLGEKYRPKK